MMRPTTISTRTSARTFTFTSTCAIAIAAALGLMATADARPLHADHHGRSPGAYARAVPDAGPAGGRLEEFYGTSVPYDADGPGYNDFQLQGR